MNAAQLPVTLAWTGASGAQYGIRLLECLLGAGRPVKLLISDAARVVIKMETDLRLPARNKEAARALATQFGACESQLQVFGGAEWTASVASGSGAPRRMVVCPCTTGSLAAIAMGSSDNLIERAADVVLKERGQLILVPRESPFSEIHLENMLRLARLGAVILPPNPGFYHRPQRVEDLVDFVVARILDHLEVPHSLLPRWGHPDEEPSA
ncbi:aromatic acid decarboxylase [Alkalilimnicola ehrlichii]|uniref:Flavin prenyltransferase UbiX n=1 Tax=Alkalilimnicola ehrlichii TaxID=351052 RepID=A0A3E0X0V4_9GAMM|nr:flavin prenyltransferase UbiX [Alkalilimnicola ehrlichii]RFA31446.1 aromatic acid decarboxylase [Alkalilimnicola ehrlichii]RFA39283.1 aromatic acid decarboxylase [Alkalilimnicola ehrlichii]